MISVATLLHVAAHPGIHQGEAHPRMELLAACRLSPAAPPALVSMSQEALADFRVLIGAGRRPIIRDLARHTEEATGFPEVP